MLSRRLQSPMSIQSQLHCFLSPDTACHLKPIGGQFPKAEPEEIMDCLIKLRLEQASVSHEKIPYICQPVGENAASQAVEDIIFPPGAGAVLCVQAQSICLGLQFR